MLCVTVWLKVWHIKKLAKEREEARKREKNKDLNEPELVLPQLAGRLENRAYMPGEQHQKCINIHLVLLIRV